jgi:hypothetical protein
MGRKTPQEKKQLSYDKDRRNVYGEAPHAARKSVPLHKRLRNRANRHAQEQALPPVAVSINEDVLDEIDSRMHARAPIVWNKSPDHPLRQVIQRKQRRRRRAESDSV